MHVEPLLTFREESTSALKTLYRSFHQQTTKSAQSVKAALPVEQQQTAHTYNTRKRLRERDETPEGSGTKRQRISLPTSSATALDRRDSFGQHTAEPLRVTFPPTDSDPTIRTMYTVIGRLSQEEARKMTEHLGHAQLLHRTIGDLLAAKQSPQELSNALSTLPKDEFFTRLKGSKLIFVFTAHPSNLVSPATENTVRKLLKPVADPKRTHSKATIASNVTTFLDKPLIRSEAPTVDQEVDYLVHMFNKSLFKAVGDHFHDLHVASDQHFGESPRLPYEIAFHTWTAGDRDGNPSVTAEFTKLAADTMQRAVLRKYSKTLKSIRKSLPADATNLAKDIQELEDTLHKIHNRASTDERPQQIRTPEQLRLELHNLSVQAAALPETQQALHRLSGQVQVFGFHLASIEWRNDAKLAYHTFEYIRKQADPHCAPWEQLDAQEKLTVLRKVRKGDISPRASSASDSSLDKKTAHPAPEVQEFLASLRALGEIRREHGAAAMQEMILANTTRADELLMLDALAEQCEVYKHTGKVQIVPLFESIETLQGADDIVKDLFSNEHFKNNIVSMGNTFEAMIGYSDSAKDGGRWSADTEIAKTQQRIAAICQAEGITFLPFHGSGGTIGRGSKQPEQALRAIQGIDPKHVKRTIQGETFFQQFANPLIAKATLNRWLAAIMSLPLKQDQPLSHMSDTGRGHELLQEASRRSEEIYRQLVHQNPHFGELLAEFSELSGVKQLRVSSRPPSRKSQTAGIAALRAVPFQQAGNLSLNPFTVWYGPGTALKEALSRSDNLAIFRETYQHNAHFKDAIDLHRIALQKTSFQTFDRNLDRAIQHGISEYDARGFLNRLHQEADDLADAIHRITDERIVPLNPFDSIIKRNEAVLAALAQRFHDEENVQGLHTAYAGIAATGDTSRETTKNHVRGSG